LYNNDDNYLTRQEKNITISYFNKAEQICLPRMNKIAISHCLKILITL